MSTLPFRSALVTGASSGIGEAITRRLAAAAVPVVVVARRTDRLEALAAELSGIEVLGADLTSAEGLAAVVARIERGDIDLVVNNAGFGTSGELHELDPDRLEREVTLNVQALTRLSHAALTTMIPARRGFLLNVSSVASFQPAPKLAVYAATKAYVTSLTESLHQEARPHGVHVTALCPGLTKTEFQSISSSDRYASSYPSWAWTTVEQVADCGLRDVARNKALSVPGLLYKGMVTAADIAPRGLLRRAASLVQR